MARTLIAAHHVATLAARQPRIAVGTAGLAGILLLELVVLLLGSHTVG